MRKGHFAENSNPASMHFLKTKALFLFLLPFFFVLHGFYRHYNSILVVDALLLILLYFGIAFAITAIIWPFYRNSTKASLIAFFIMGWQFFFSNIQDGLKQLTPDSFISQYRFLLPFGLLLFILLVAWLKKRKAALPGFTFYLNSLLLVLILVDSVLLVSKMATPVKNNTLYPSSYKVSACDTCNKPDIYLIVLDQYASCTALKDAFNFDNSVFENKLEQRGFFIAKKSSSNYNLTPFSMASIFNMDYLTEEVGEKGNLNIGYSYRLIKNNRVLDFLKAHGYQFYNYSTFDCLGQPGKKYPFFFPYGTDLITMQTFTSRLTRDIRLDILRGKFNFKKTQKKIAYEYLHFNDGIFDLTLKAAANKSPAAKFVYSHLILPHYPYYFDSSGKPVPIEKLIDINSTNANDYLGYLQYGNGRVLQLIDEILARSQYPPVIMLLSDHGFRHPEKTIDRKYDFMNLNATYIPNKNYKQFNDSLSGVNHFRVFFNTSFNQQLPLLKDSTIDLWD